MRTPTSMLTILALTFALGCVGGDDGDLPVPDAGASAADGGNSSNPDAMPSNVADGLACTATMEDPQGGCPTTHTCLIAGCAQLCTLGTDGNPDGAACPNYTGPGVSLCIVSVQDDQMNTVAAACGIFCEDSSASIPGCDGAACDGTCPNTLSCQQHPNPMAPVGLKLCQ